MSIQKIPCGGFYYDDSEIVFENGVIHSLGGGSGLPPVEGSGKVLVAVDGEWKEIDGYGYSIEGENTATFDPDEDLPSGGYRIYSLIDEKISDENLEKIVGINNYGENVSVENIIESEEQPVIQISMTDGSILAYVVSEAVISGQLMQPGLYVMYRVMPDLPYYLTSVTFTTTFVQKIDNQYIDYSSVKQPIIVPFVYEEDIDKYFTLIRAEELHNKIEAGYVVMGFLEDVTFHIEEGQYGLNIWNIEPQNTYLKVCKLEYFSEGDTGDYYTLIEKSLSFADM